MKHFKSVVEGVHKFTSKAQNPWNVKTADKFIAVERPLERLTLRKIASEPKNRYIPFRKKLFLASFSSLQYGNDVTIFACKYNCALFTLE